MNKYELGVVIRADVAEDVYRAELERVKALVERFGGTIERIDDWGRRKLAYPIAKQTEGMYTFITYDAPGSTVREVENRLNLMENVLRFLTIAKEEGDVNTPPPVKVVPHSGTAAPEAPAPASPASEELVEAPPAEDTAEVPAEESVTPEEAGNE